ncbi:FMN-binding protein [Vagococcus carniphilus]|uniref:FMN-binding protein n=1 Tax=Vagococcus carniphilus TaxID=218144 RepID=A0AAW8U005_9ENTE|nr:extracellular electron transfer flavoprotein PplA [Vagococcus carniphilus]MDT2815341.1 FMN-binding protein [Vagococcus carniphilus]MDT2831349.1 FMN-binding protein [Vagococcus carniphilus]MDT2832878.1 FMN-binding protein [Vagococcus carniphilus]MDT2840317.1 FMN-binding protein [Vagococcus carniphilus]MDT2849016.1 FMN-binding protein [Vagococcus carniphilus]
MKMKKLITGVTVLAMSTLLLAACGGSKDKDTKESTAASSSVAKTDEKKEEAPKKQIAGGELKDGEYTLEEKNENNDYRATFTMVVKDGKITESKYDNINKDGKSKTEDKDYNKAMEEKAKTSPEKFIPELNEALVAAQSADGVDVVTGATHSAESFKNYAQQLIQAAQAGKTDKIEIDNGAKLKDGDYTLEEKNESNGYRTVFTMVVKDGKIAESKYDNINKDGKSKTEDADYNKMMKEQAKTNPEAFIPELNKGLVEKQKPSEMDVVTGATHSTHSFQMYAEQLINAAEKGDTAKIEVDNIVFEK